MSESLVSSMVVSSTCVCDEWCSMLGVLTGCGELEHSPSPEANTIECSLEQSHTFLIDESDPHEEELSLPMDSKRDLSWSRIILLFPIQNGSAVGFRSDNDPDSCDLAISGVHVEDFVHFLSKSLGHLPTHPRVLQSSHSLKQWSGYCREQGFREID